MNNNNDEKKKNVTPHQMKKKSHVMARGYTTKIVLKKIQNRTEIRTSFVVNETSNLARV